MKNNNIPESLAALRVEIPKYERTIYVRSEDISKIMSYVKDTCYQLNLPIPRVYISGFVLANMGNLTSTEAISGILSDVVKSISNKENQKVANIK